MAPLTVTSAPTIPIPVPSVALIDPATIIPEVIAEEKTQVEEADGVYVFDVVLDGPSQKTRYKGLDPADDAEDSEQEGVMESSFVWLA